MTLYTKEGQEMSLENEKNKAEAFKNCPEILEAIANYQAVVERVKKEMGVSEFVDGSLTVDALENFSTGKPS